MCSGAARNEDAGESEIVFYSLPLSLYLLPPPSADVADDETSFLRHALDEQANLLPGRKGRRSDAKSLSRGGTFNSSFIPKPTFLCTDVCSSSTAGRQASCSSTEPARGAHAGR